MNRVFENNIELWAQTDPKHALMLPYHDCSAIALCESENGMPNLKMKKGSRWSYLHSKKDPEKEAQEWFSAIDLRKGHVLYIYGVGLGYYYDAIKGWLKKNKERRLVFLEDDLSVISRFLETERAARLLSDCQVQLLYFKDLKDNDAVFEVLYWDFAMTRMTVSALRFYEEHKNELYTQLAHKIAFDSAVKNALVDEYLRFGGPFFVNFYQNMLSLPGSYLGNHTFGKFRKVPAIICGAGPSLSKSLPLLSQLLDKALVFAGGSALNALNAAGIQPHFGAGIDPNPAQYERLAANQGFEVPFYYRNRMYHDAFERIHGPRLYVTGCGGYDVAEYFEEKLGIKQEFLDEGHNVVNFCLQIAHQLGCDPIIFVGMDLAFTGMKSYAPGVEENVEFDPDKFADAGEFDEKPFLKADIYGQPLYTLWKWVAESEWIGKFAEEHPEVTILNATEGGLGFPKIPNDTLKQVAEDYLTRSYSLQDRLHGEIQLSSMPQATPRKVVKAMKDLCSSLKRCIAFFDILVEEAENELSCAAPAFVQSGRAALCETELAEEPGYQYVLDIFNAVQARLYNRHLHEAKNAPGKRKLRKKWEINLKRFNFLREAAKVNVGVIEMALEKRKKMKRGKGRGKEGKHSDVSILPPEYKLKSFDPAYLPLNVTEGAKAKGGRIATILRQYGKPPEEARLELKGVPDGQCLLYYDGGALKAEVFYKQGKLHGPSTFYAPDGIVLSKSWFDEGVQVGECKRHYLSGHVYCIQRYKNGLLEGLQEYYYEDGTPKTYMEYKHGLLDGEVKTFWPDGEVKWRFAFAAGIKTLPESVGTIGT